MNRTIETNENYNHEDDDSCAVNSQDDGTPVLCRCGETVALHEAHRSIQTGLPICTGCHVDEMVEKDVK